ncbi:MAG: glycogen/starch/alpha-glucan phosphorylase [Acidobacteria bacterium]|nr:glycogen/starch/alpha-glucan phosphorylase [Acidobacteriota bacterium]
MANSKQELNVHALYHGMDAQAISTAFQDHLEYTLAKDRFSTTDLDRYMALSYTIRDRLIERWLRTQDTYYQHDSKRVYYLSMEFLIGRTLTNSLINLGLYDECRKALEEMDLELESVAELEWDAGLGNGGLGRLAACFLDSMATLGLPGYGYGIRYEYGIFNQRIKNGNQVERPDNWLRFGNPWEIPRPQVLYPINFYGHVLQYVDRKGHLVSEWLETTEVMAMAYDIPVPGYQTNTVNTLRLWSAKASRDFDFTYFNEGDYIGAVEAKNDSETISKVLYPNDNRVSGKELRLKQEYFFVSATLQDIMRRYKKVHTTFDQIPEKIAIQLNDTHPAIAIAEFMRILLDQEHLEWDKAWKMTTQVFGYTNHTVMPEALERWPVTLLGKVLPRHLQIIYEVNHQFLQQVRALHPNDDNLCARMSLIEEPAQPGGEKHVRMAYLAIVGSHSTNGVAALHTEILKNDLFKDFYQMFPEKFNNKTNGITQRRWLKMCNMKLSALINDAIGDEWTTNLDHLKKLIPFAEDAEFRKQWQAVKRHNKKRLAGLIKGDTSLDSIFDTQVKRLHEYKRQLLNVLHVITAYNRIRENRNVEYVPRTVIFGGKAAPGYAMAKLIIKLIHAVGEVVNQDPAVRGLLKVVFLPNYRVSLAERIIPGTDLSEQISTAGTEASGTGNMKFALNGALTIGTLDGANIEMLEEIGEDNMFIFGLKADEVRELRKTYNPKDYYNQNTELKQVLDMIQNGYFSPLHRDLFDPIIHSLLYSGDQYMLLADYAAYIECQDRVSEVYRDQEEWTRRSILNVANVGKFSSDRTIRQYAEEIWDASPVTVDMSTCLL